MDNYQEKVLIDTGGRSLGPALGKLVEHLRLAGVEPASVTAILLTHAHLDHVSGIADRAGELQFPNARIYLCEPEWRF